MAWFRKEKKRWDSAKIKAVLDDLTHLEINTIVKTDMTGAKPPKDEWLLLYGIIKRYHVKLTAFGEKYKAIFPEEEQLSQKYFRGPEVKKGVGWESFDEMRQRAETTYMMLEQRKTFVLNHSSQAVDGGDLETDIALLFRIYKNAAHIRNMLKNQPQGHVFDDNEEGFREYRDASLAQRQPFALDLDLGEVMQLRKIYDLGTERIVMQTRIGLDGDVTTRISSKFANEPVDFINELHHRSTNISLDFWKTLVNIVTTLGKSLINNLK